MKFFAGVLLGLLLAGPSITHHSPIERNTFVVTVTAEKPDPSARRSHEWYDADGQEGCIIEMLGGPGANWDAQDVIDILDVAWVNYAGPCDMMERQGESSGE